MGPTRIVDNLWHAERLKVDAVSVTFYLLKKKWL